MEGQTLIMSTCTSVKIETVIFHRSVCETIMGSNNLACVTKGKHMTSETLTRGTEYK